MGRYPGIEIPTGRLGPLAAPRRVQSIAEAVAWAAGPSLEEQLEHTVYEHEIGGVLWEVRAAKPGKEAFEGRVNVNDMYPRIYRQGQHVPIRGSFTRLWEGFKDVGHHAGGVAAMGIIGRVLAAGAYMIGHEQDEDGRWRLGGDATAALDEAAGFVATIPFEGHDIPTRTAVEYLEVIALQEDVKYWTLSADADEARHLRGSVGRVNNLQTSAAVALYVRGDLTLSELLGNAGRQPTGVVTFSQVRLRQLIPPLA